MVDEVKVRSMGYGGTLWCALGRTIDGRMVAFGFGERGLRFLGSFVDLARLGILGEL